MVELDFAAEERELAKTPECALVDGRVVGCVTLTFPCLFGEGVGVGVVARKGESAVMGAVNIVLGDS